MIYNFDTESTLVRDDQTFETIEAYTDKVTSSIRQSFLGRAGEENAIVYEPDHLVVASNEREVIPFHEGVHVVKTDATSIVETYYLQIKVDGLQYVSSARAVLTGMVGSNASRPPRSLSTSRCKKAMIKESTCSLRYSTPSDASKTSRTACL